MSGDHLSTISFNYIKSLFDEKHWDIGVLTPELFHRVNLHPVKIKLNGLDYGEDYANDIHFLKETNVIVFIRDGHTWDYTHYEQVMDILEINNVRDKSPYHMVYTNFKESAILSGLGVRAKNSLIYSYKFGFDCHIATVRFEKEIVDLPTDKRINYKIWNRCVGCDDCAKACPVGAIHNKGEPFSWWLDSDKCDNFIGTSNHEKIPSIKKFWYENVYPELPYDHVYNVTSGIMSSLPMNEGGLSSMPWDRNGYSYDGQVVKKDGKVVNIPFCRECTSQPRCSKWNGNYPYDKVYNQEDINIIDMAKR